MNSQASLLFLILIGITLVASSPMLLQRDSIPFTKASNSSTGPTCQSNVTCAGKGDTCSGDENSNFKCSSNGTNCCASGLYCLSGTCQTDNMGQSCNTTLDCKLPVNDIKGTAYNCQGSPKICTYLSLPGDSCTITNGTSNCIPGITCSNSTNMCVGVAPGGACIGDYQCQFGYQCSGAECVAQTASGGSCDSSSECYPGLSCVASKCASPNQGAAGAACIARDNTGCQSGFACASNSTCVAVTSSLTTCTNNTDCAQPAICLCSQVSGNSYCFGSAYIFNPCTSEDISLQSCLASNNCSSYPYGTDAPDSCCYAHCLSEFKKSISCDCSFTNDFLGDCYYNQYCGGFPVWAIIVIIVVAIVLVLAIVLLVFFMMRRRRQYDSI